MAKEKKPVPDQVFKRDSGHGRRSSETRPQRTTPTSGLRNLDRKGSISPPKSRQREISWIDYEDLIKARQDEKDVMSPKIHSRSPLISSTPSRGKSSSGNQSKKKLAKEEDEDDIKHNVKFSTSLPVQPKETLPFPFLRRTSQITLPGEKRRSSFNQFSLEHGKNFEGELHTEDGCSIVATPRVPGDNMWRDTIREPPSINQKLDVEGFAMHIPQYLLGMRGDSRRSSLRALSIFDEVLTNHRRSAFVKSVMAKTNIDGIQPNQVSIKYITMAPKARLSTVIVPVNAKQWLLQIMCQKDSQLRELFDQMDLVPQFAGDHVREVRAEWENLEAFHMPVPSEAQILIKDKTLINKVRGLLAHYNEEENKTKIEEENKTKMEEGKKIDDFEEIKENAHEPTMGESNNNLFVERKNSYSRSSSKIFEGFERDQEGSLSPVFGIGASLCPLCKQTQKRSFGRDDQNTTKLLGLDGNTRNYLSFNGKRWFIVLFPVLQLANRDKIELLGEWLRYAIHHNNCEDHDGQYSDVGSAFILHSIAFLEVVRQVRLQCEERGDMLLHVWRQILRVFSQVMIRVEPKLVEILKETSFVKDTIFSIKQKNDQLSHKITTTNHNLEVGEAQLSEKELQWSQLKRCHFCTEGDQMHLKGSTTSSKHGLGASRDSEEEVDGKTHQKNKDQENEDGNLGQVGGGGDIGDGTLKPRGNQNISGSSGFGSLGSVGGIDNSSDNKRQNEDIESYKPGKISEGYLHPDGLFSDVGIQTDQAMTKLNPFSKILMRPITAPGRLITAVMEEFQLAGGIVHRDLVDGEEPIVTKEPEVVDLTAADIAALDAKDDMSELDEIGFIDKLALKNLANDSIHILEKIPEDQLEAKMAESLFGILGRFRNLKVSGSEEDDKDDEGETHKKKSKWSKLKSGLKKQKEGGDRLVAIVQELLARQKKPPLKMTKPKDLPNIPLGFSKMMKINPPPKLVKLFNEHQVIKLVDAVYLKKIEADAIDDAQGNERQNACEFLYDFMLNSYGLKGLAESAIHGVFRRIKQMMAKGIDKSHKLRLFQQFCGFDPLRGYGEPDFYLYLKTLSKAQSKVGALFTTENEDGTFINTNPNQTDILLEEPIFFAQFKEDKDVAVDFLEKFAANNGFVEKVSSEVQKMVKSPTVRKVDFDLLMEAVIEISPHKADYKKPPSKMKIVTKTTQTMTKEQSTSLEKLFIAGDANQDGVLTFSEFREIIATADSSIPEAKALRMFRETLQLMPDGGDSISPSTFATVAHSYDIQATPAMIFDLLKKTWTQIQDDINEEKFRDEDKKKDCEDVRATLEDMLKDKKPANVFNAVQIFSTFVLKYCGEIEGVAKVPEEPKDETIEDEETND